jgi:hypothetical protein
MLIDLIKAFARADKRLQKKKRRPRLSISRSMAMRGLIFPVSTGIYSLQPSPA